MSHKFVDKDKDVMLDQKGSKKFTFFRKKRTTE